MRIACLGEVMIELRPAVVGGALSLGIGGDTYNTAVMLARQGVETSYLSSLGSDQFSEQIVTAARSEGIQTSGIQRLSGALPGLYLIQNDAAGEREFFYWRDSSPARQLFASHEGVAACVEQVKRANWLYLSGITVAVMAQQHEDAFLHALTEIKLAGVHIAFDPNYRPRLWRSAKTALRWLGLMLERSDLVLPTLADEQALWGASGPQAIIERCRDAGASQVVVKCPDAQAIAWCNGERAERRSNYTGPVIDTTGAGDAFNAGFMAAYLDGIALEQSLDNAHRIASQVLAVHGAVPAI